MAKAFDFAELTTRQNQESAVFLTPALRSTTEELIFLKFLSTIPEEERNLILTYLLELEVSGDVACQAQFFGRFRPFQPVLPMRKNNRAQIEEDLRCLWRKHGYPNFNKKNQPIIPQTREICKKLDAGMLEVVYDYIYRLASNSVHFRSRNLLRMGWGKSKTEFTFTSKSMPEYHLGIVQTYGSFLLCLYFELFGDLVEVNQDEKLAVTALRELLLQKFDWPEIVTLEEMNFDYPEINNSDRFLQIAYAVIMEQGFLEGSKTLLGTWDGTANRSARSGNEQQRS